MGRAEPAAPELPIVELNVSCPNTADGLQFGEHPGALRELLGAVRPALGRTKMLVKLSPNVGDIVAMARAAIDGGADGLTLINTVSAMGIDVETFMKTLAEYNSSCALHYDDVFCKDRRFLTPLEGKKFYILRIVPGAYGTLGGIKIDSHYQVLTQEGKKLYGLYAAGSDVCDLYAGTYLYYLPGNTMGFALNSGRLAAEQAAEFINSLEPVA